MAKLAVGAAAAGSAAQLGGDGGAGGRSGLVPKGLGSCWQSSGVGGASRPQKRRRPRHDSPDAALREDPSPPRRRARHDTPDSDAILSGLHDAQAAKGAAAGGGGLREVSTAPKAGLVSWRDLKAEMDRECQAERERFARLGAERSGRGAETVHRDAASGRRVSAEELAAAAQAAQKPEVVMPAWLGGIVQMRAREAAAAEMAADAGKPFVQFAPHSMSLCDQMRHWRPGRMQRLERASGTAFAAQETLRRSWLDR